MWGSVVVSLLFWQFANEITRTNEAKRFYALFPLLGNIALILSGQTVTYFSTIRDVNTADAWGTSLNYMMGTRSEEHTSELQSLMRISYAVFCLKKKKTN